VGGRSPALEQPGGCEHERPGAHGGHAAGVRGQPPYLGEQLRVCDRSVHVRSAGHHEGVDRTGDVGEGGRGELQPAARADRPSLCGHDLGAVVNRGQEPRGAGEDLERSRDVENLRGVEGDDDDRALPGHRLSMHRRYAAPVADIVNNVSLCPGIAGHTLNACQSPTCSTPADGPHRGSFPGRDHNAH
jgi:hypothetical protein